MLLLPDISPGGPSSVCAKFQTLFNQKYWNFGGMSVWHRNFCDDHQFGLAGSHQKPNIPLESSDPVLSNSNHRFFANSTPKKSYEARKVGQARDFMVHVMKFQGKNHVFLLYDRVLMMKQMLFLSTFVHLCMSIWTVRLFEPICTPCGQCIGVRVPFLGIWCPLIMMMLTGQSAWLCSGSMFLYQTLLLPWMQIGVLPSFVLSVCSLCIPPCVLETMYDSLPSRLDVVR